MSKIVGPSSPPSKALNGSLLAVSIALGATDVYGLTRKDQSSTNKVIFGTLLATTIILGGFNAYNLHRAFQAEKAEQPKTIPAKINKHPAHRPALVGMHV